MTYTLQELEALCTAAQGGEWSASHDGEGHSSVWAGPVVAGASSVMVCTGLRWSQNADFIAAARTAIPELIAKIRELDPSFNATPLADSVARAQELMREAGEKRAKLASAVAAAKLGSLEELNALGLEAFFEADGSVKVRQKQRKAAGT